MIIPPFLKQNDKVAIVAPARWVEQDKYNSIINILGNYGFEVIRGKTTFLEHGPFAGNDAERLSDLQEMLDNPEIKAIFCLRGGYGTIRIIDKLDFSAFNKNPKWVIGFSDITILHNTIHNLGIASVHGQMPLNFANRTNNDGLDKLISTLKGENLSYEINKHSLNREGNGEAKIVGGNVAILCSLIGTPYDIDTDGKILFIEEVGEYLYRFDRLIHHLKMSGKFAKLAGLIVGGLSDMNDNSPAFGQTAEQIVADTVNEYNYPVCFGFPAGHIKENYPLVFGKNVHFKVDDGRTFMNF